MLKTFFNHYSLKNRRNENQRWDCCSSRATQYCEVAAGTQYAFNPPFVMGKIEGWLADSVFRVPLFETEDGECK